MRPGNIAWLTLGAAVLGYEVAAASRRDWDLLSEAVDRYRAAAPAPTLLAIWYIAGHLARVWPRHLDPLSIISDHLGARLGRP